MKAGKRSCIYFKKENSWLTRKDHTAGIYIFFGLSEMEFLRESLDNVGEAGQGRIPFSLGIIVDIIVTLLILF